MKNKKSPIVTWLFSITGIVLAAINAALTWSFGFTYFGPAFGSGLLADYLAGFYALLIMDVLYLTWFWVYLNGSTGKHQRALAFVMSIVSLAASILATINQLVVNSFSLVDLSQYQDGVGTAALVSMVLLTALHIVAFAGFILFDPIQKVKSRTADSLSDVLEDAIDQAQRLVDQDKDQLVSSMSGQIRNEILIGLGYTSELKRIGNGSAGPLIIDQDEDEPERQPAMEPQIVTYTNGSGRPANFHNGR